MKKIVFLAVGASLLLAVGVAWAGTSGSSTPQDPATVSTSTRQVAADVPAAGEAVTSGAGRAGAVTYRADETGLTVTAVSPARGWSYTIKATGGREIEVVFRKGAARVDFEAELEDGQVQVRVRTSAVGGATTTTGQDGTDTTNGNPTSTSNGNVTSTSFDDDVTSTSNGNVTSTSFDDNGARRRNRDDDSGGDDNGGERWPGRRRRRLTRHLPGVTTAVEATASTALSIPRGCRPGAARARPSPRRAGSHRR